MTTPTPAQAEALKLRQKLTTGEEIPLPDLVAFITLSNQSLERQRKQAEAPRDVDFF